MKKILLFLCCFLAGKLFAQVNLQTGSAQYAVPVYQFSDNQSRLSLGVSLNYHSGNGLLVNDIASNVGTGWGLAAGGSITRMQVGEPDDQPERNGAFDDISRYPAGYLYNGQSIADGCPEGMAYYPIFREKNQQYKDHGLVAADREQDRFLFNMNGRTGVFVIGKNLVPKVLGDNNLKIEFTRADMRAGHVRTTITEFTITDEQGIRYVFRDKSYKKQLRYKNALAVYEAIQVFNGLPTNTDIKPMIATGLSDAEDPFIVTAWQLTSIEDPFANRFIGFEYDTRLLETRTGDVVIATESPYNKVTPSVIGPVIITPAIKRHAQVMQVKDISQVKTIQKINFPSGEQLRFEYNNTRSDIKGDKALSSIALYSNDILVHDYRLTQGYFKGNTIEADGDRLCLKSIQQTGQDNSTVLPPYQFEYYTGTPGIADDTVPARGTYKTDIWGYYNGDASNIAAEPAPFYEDVEEYFKCTNLNNKKPKPGYAKNGLMKKIILPAGGSLQFEYEQNQDDASNFDNHYTGGVRVRRTTLHNAQDTAQDITKEYRYVQADGSSSGWGFEPVLNVSELRVKYEPNGTWWNPVTGCEHKWKYPGISYPEENGGEIVRKASAQNKTTQVLLWANDQTSAVINLATAEFSRNAIALSIGSFLFNVVVVAIITCDESAYRQNDIHRTHVNYNIKAPGALPTRYARVEEADVVNNGSIIYEFTNRSFKDLISLNNNFPYPASQRAPDWAYSLPKRVTVYDKDGLIKQRTDNEYEVTVNPITDNNYLSCKCGVKTRTSISSYDWDSNPFYTYTQTSTENSNITPAFYSPYTGRTQLVSTKVRDYTKEGTYHESFTRYEYHPQLFLPNKVITANPAGDTLEQFTYYPQDYTGIAVLQQLKNANALAIPVATETWLRKTSSNGKLLLSAGTTEFATLPNGDIRPKQLFALETDQPVPESTIGVFNPAVLVRNTDYFKSQGIITYNAEGMNVQEDSRTRTTATLYDYNNRYAVASVANAAYNDIAYTGFEADGTGNWTYSNEFIDRTQSITGRACFNLTPGSVNIVKTGLNINKTYFVSCWAKNGTVLVNNLPGTALTTIGDWSLYSFGLSDATEAGLSGSAVIDDLRLYPKGAFMTTATYDPAIGKTAQTNANNQIIYYEYDGLGRMIQVRDEKRNIIKTFEYNYKQ
jgi:YD repeat-containing protein